MHSGFEVCALSHMRKRLAGECLMPTTFVDNGTRNSFPAPKDIAVVSNREAKVKVSLI